METLYEKIGFGGGCHWCTEAVFQSLIGVKEVEQGWIGAGNEESSLSEAVIVHFNKCEISLERLIEIHLATHSSSTNHSMRKKYRSAVYFFTEKQRLEATLILQGIKKKARETIITQVLPFHRFEASRSQIQGYYEKNPKSPFCQRYIIPKLKKVNREFKNAVKQV